MIKILHSADWHLDSPLNRSGAELLRQTQQALPEKIVRLAQAEGCSLLLLSGDLFDGDYSRDTLRTVQRALGRAGMPVLISPGNHDPWAPGSVWQEPGWPDNVTVFTKQHLEALILPELDCRIYGAGYQSMDCPALLSDFVADGSQKWRIGLLHGDATNAASPYCPITAAQVRHCGLHYLALGHIHKTGSVRAGGTLCAWPGSPMARGFDETGPRGVLLVTLDEQVHAEFLPLDVPQFHVLETSAGDDPLSRLSALLPAAGSSDFFRVRLTGAANPPDLDALAAALPQFPNLELIDDTVPEADIWSAAGEDTLEGLYFRFLRDAMQGQDADVCDCLRLAASISRKILDGQEVTLP